MLERRWFRFPPDSGRVKYMSENVQGSGVAIATEWTLRHRLESGGLALVGG